jgi:hypothetical protein
MKNEKNQEKNRFLGFFLPGVVRNLKATHSLPIDDEGDDDDDDNDTDDVDDDDDVNKPVWPTWAVGALFRGARRPNVPSRTPVLEVSQGLSQLPIIKKLSDLIPQGLKEHHIPC